MGNAINEDIYNAYFGRKPDDKDTAAAEPEKYDGILYKDRAAQHLHMYETVPSADYDMHSLRLMADGNISGIEQLADILKRLCNAAWGDKWGELSPDLKTGEDSSNIILPQITAEINYREHDENMNGPKPKLTDIIDETDDSGEKTGDAFLIYRQWYACNVEFNIYAHNSAEARKVQKRFEDLITVYTGYLKRHGISEIWFENETHPKCSLNYNETIPMRSIYYFIRFEAIMPVRQSVINTVNTEIGVNTLDTQRIRTLIETEKPELVEFEFFSGDNGITFSE